VVHACTDWWTAEQTVGANFWSARARRWRGGGKTVGVGKVVGVGDGVADGGVSPTLAKATYVNSYRGGPLLYTNPPGVSLNRLELKKQMRYFFCAKTFCVLQKMFWGKSLA
jgi:hypothetical protein